MMNALVAFTEAEGGSAVPFPPPRNLVEWAPFFGDGTAFRVQQDRPDLVDRILGTHRHLPDGSWRVRRSPLKDPGVGRGHRQVHRRTGR